MIDHIGPTLALVGLYIGIAGLILLAFSNASQAADQSSDDLADRLLHGDIRTGDLLQPPHDRSL